MPFNWPSQLQKSKGQSRLDPMKYFFKQLFSTKDFLWNTDEWYMFFYWSPDIFTKYQNQTPSPNINPDMIRTQAVVIRISPLVTAPTRLICQKSLPGVAKSPLTLNSTLPAFLVITGPPSMIAAWLLRWSVSARAPSQCGSLSPTTRERPRCQGGVRKLITDVDLGRFAHHFNIAWESWASWGEWGVGGK